MHYIVTIDGPAGTGKSTVARQLAIRLQIGFLDTGAMYRAVAWHCLQNNINTGQGEQAAEIAQRLRFRLNGHQLLVNDADPGEKLRSILVTQSASQFAAHQAVRQVLVEQQQKIGASQSLVTEGRDQGTVVFPQARSKFFLTARPEIRAQRRYHDLLDTPESQTVEEILQAQTERDHRDQSRAASPLRPAADAHIIDTSDYTQDEVVDVLEQYVRQATASDH